MKKTAVVTGASSGIGAATARALAKDGFHVIIGARRLDRLKQVAAEIGARALQLDVTDPSSVEACAAEIDAVDVLVNNAGGAQGLAPLMESSIEDWQWMYETNVLGTVRMTKALLPKLRATRGLVVNIGSKAALDPYPGGSGYNAAKFGLRALTRVTRLEEIATSSGVRVTEIDPGRVETEFSLVRFGGDAERAAEVYADKLNLTADDVAEAVRWVSSLPAHVNIDSLNIMPADQG